MCTFCILHTCMSRNNRLTRTARVIRGVCEMFAKGDLFLIDAMHVLFRGVEVASLTRLSVGARFIAAVCMIVVDGRNELRPYR